MLKVLKKTQGIQSEKHLRPLILFAIVFLSLFCFIQTGTASDELTNDDCIKCHKRTALMVKENGGSINRHDLPDLPSGASSYGEQGKDYTCLQ